MTFKIGDRVRIKDSFPSKCRTGTLVHTYSYTSFYVQLDEPIDGYECMPQFPRGQRGWLLGVGSLELLTPPKPGSVEAYIQRELHNV